MRGIHDEIITAFSDDLSLLVSAVVPTTLCYLLNLEKRPYYGPLT